MKTKILYWAPFFLPDIGGIEVLSAELLPKLQERNYEIIVVTSHGQHDIADKSMYHGIPIHRFHFRTAIAKGHLSQIIGIRKKIAELKHSFAPDLVHIHFSDPSVYFHWTTAHTHPALTLVTVHLGLKYFGLKSQNDTLLKRTLSMADWVTAVSQATLSELQQAVPKLKKRSSVIYNGMASPALLPKPLPWDVPQILCVGRLVHQKGFDLMLKAFAKLSERFPQARLTIVGDGPIRSDLEQQAVALGVEDVVEFLGRVAPERISEVLNHATMVVMPSRDEGFPMVALEAAQMARPIIATPVGGLPEALIHRETGLIVAQEDEQALTEAMTFLLNHPGIAKKMGEAGRSRIREVFGLERCVDAYSMLYRQLIQPAPLKEK